jgi:hypothetical protein
MKTAKEQKGRLEEAARDHEEKWAAAAKALEKEWIQIVKHLENRDRLWAALHFLRNPRKFEYGER